MNRRQREKAKRRAGMTMEMPSDFVEMFGKAFELEIMKTHRTFAQIQMIHLWLANNPEAEAAFRKITIIMGKPSTPEAKEEAEEFLRTHYQQSIEIAEWLEANNITTIDPNIDKEAAVRFQLRWKGEA